MTALRTPLYDRHVAAGGRMVDFAGWMMPVQYSGIVAEHTAVRTAAGLFDISHMGRLSIGGPDALDMIDYSWTNDAASMKDGQVRYGLVGNDHGGIMRRRARVSLAVWLDDGGQRHRIARRSSPGLQQLRKASRFSSTIRRSRRA